VTHALSIDRLRVVYDDFIALRDVSLTVNAGESFGLVGESGSGKSTLLRAVAGLAPVSGGTIDVSGQRLGKVRDKTFYRQVQMVFQDPYGSLHPRQTVDRLLLEPLDIHGFGDTEKRILRALDEVGLGSSFRFRYSHQLSGGQRQRVAIARALILEPSILLLDEPTSALDASVQAEVLNLLEQVRRDRKLTFIMVSHDLGVITHMCERLMVMQGGQEVERLQAGDLATRNVAQDYTRNLLVASEGFVRGA
jgi:peptide/nickel transport system ATP-binding protein